MDNKLLGKKGEQKAVEFLKEKGYQIIEQNFLKRMGEIDKIAFDPKYKEYVFIEVKTRSNLSFGHPEESVTQQKINKIVRTAEIWINNQKLDDPEWRIDIIGIYWGKRGPEIEHIENI